MTIIKLSGEALMIGALIDAAACKYEHEAMARYAVNWVIRGMVYDKMYRVWIPAVIDSQAFLTEWLIIHAETLDYAGFIQLETQD
uniref:Uncharacterized protein n=1 Tax=viral metagenome TaxID=1070528 RepID=A0A6M3JG59_9ZZZZ